MSAKQTTYIHEFVHPRLVVHFHPSPAEGPFRAEQASRALVLGVHAIELDLRHRRTDGAVACDHDRVDARSPTLAQMVDLVLAHMEGADTVNGDGRQFFLVLEPKEDDTALFDGIFATLGRYRAQLSTAAGPADSPRPITVVVTGAFHRHCHEYLYARHGEEVNRLLLAENVDYGGAIADLSRAAGPGTFQWTTLPYDDPAFAGRVNALHLGTDARLRGRFNVRVWNAKDDASLGRALASGADSISCNGAKVAGFEALLLDQEPRGLLPRLTVRGGQALLVWDDAARSGELYAALGRMDAAGIAFSRQLDLTVFLQEKPTAAAPAAASTPTGDLLVAYERAGALWYVSGRLTSADRFLTFAGGEHRLTADAGALGSSPSVAVAPGGRVLVVHSGSEAGRLRYFSGVLDPAGQLTGAEHDLSRGSARRGSTPAVAIDRSGRVVVVYEGTTEHRLWYVSGSIGGDGRIVGDEHALARRGTRPAVAFDADGRIVVAYENVDGAKLSYVSGRVRNGVVDGNGFDLNATGGTHPTVAFDGTGHVAVLYRSPDARFRYVHGTLDAAGRIVGRDRQLRVRLDRR